MSTVRLPLHAPDASGPPETPANRHAGERNGLGHAIAAGVVVGDRIERVACERPGTTPYVSLGADLGFLVGLQASVTLAGGKLYGSVGEFSGAVPGIGVSLEAGNVLPRCGQSVASTIEGTGFTASAGFGIGGQTTIGNAGTLVGGGLTLPSMGVGVTQTRRLLPW